MNLTETTVVAVLTVTIAATAFTVMDPPALTRKAEATAAQVSCKAVDAAVVAFVEERGIAPTSVGELGSYVRGDITAYRIRKGVAVGPGCPSSSIR